MTVPSPNSMTFGLGTRLGSGLVQAEETAQDSAFLFRRTPGALGTMARGEFRVGPGALVFGGWRVVFEVLADPFGADAVLQNGHDFDRPGQIPAAGLDEVAGPDQAG